jgi:hypothetical protein
MPEEGCRQPAFHMLLGPLRQPTAVTRAYATRAVPAASATSRWPGLGATVRRCCRRRVRVLAGHGRRGWAVQRTYGAAPSAVRAAVDRPALTTPRRRDPFGRTISTMPATIAVALTAAIKREFSSGSRVRRGFVAEPRCGSPHRCSWRGPAGTRAIERASGRRTVLVGHVSPSEASRGDHPRRGFSSARTRSDDWTAEHDDVARSVAAVEADEFGDPQPGLGGKHEQGMVASSGSVRRSGALSRASSSVSESQLTMLRW